MFPSETCVKEVTQQRTKSSQSSDWKRKECTTRIITRTIEIYIFFRVEIEAHVYCCRHFRSEWIDGIDWSNMRRHMLKKQECTITGKRDWKENIWLHVELECFDCHVVCSTPREKTDSISCFRGALLEKVCHLCAPQTHFERNGGWTTSYRRIVHIKVLKNKVACALLGHSSVQNMHRSELCLAQQTTPSSSTCTAVGWSLPFFRWRQKPLSTTHGIHT